MKEPLNISITPQYKAVFKILADMMGVSISRMVLLSVQATLIRKNLLDHPDIKAAMENEAP